MWFPPKKAPTFLAGSFTKGLQPQPSWSWTNCQWFWNSYFWAYNLSWPQWGDAAFFIRTDLLPLKVYFGNQRWNLLQWVKKWWASTWTAPYRILGKSLQEEKLSCNWRQNQLAPYLWLNLFLSLWIYSYFYFYSYLPRESCPHEVHLKVSLGDEHLKSGSSFAMSVRKGHLTAQTLITLCCPHSISASLFAKQGYFASFLLPFAWATWIMFFIEQTFVTALITAQQTHLRGSIDI